MTSHLTILTGGSRGMGLAMAQQLLQPGRTLICMARSASPALAAPAGGALEQWTLDLADGASAAGRLHAWLAAQPADAFASATLINNAGVIPRIAPLSDSDPADLAHALRVGLEAPLQLTAAFLGATSGWAVPRKVLNISSGLGRRAMASQAAYCAARLWMGKVSRWPTLPCPLNSKGSKLPSLRPTPRAISRSATCGAGPT